MRAILSDVHGNLEALTAVLADLERLGIDRVYNLGDNLGYGPDPLECLDLAARMSVVLLGNFDHAVRFTPDGFCISAEQSVLWTQAQLAAVGDLEIRERRATFLASLAASHREGDVLYVHGSPRHPLNEYIFPEDIYLPKKMAGIGAAVGRVCFAGHTHMPGIFLERAPGKWEFIHPDDCVRGFVVGRQKLICNVGSVGQPRDDDERACYVLFDGERIWFRRVEYDIEATVRKIHAIPELANFFGERLREGR